MGLTMSLPFIVALVGGVDATPPKVFLGGQKTAARSAAKFSIAYGASFAHLLMKKFWSGHVRSRSYDVIRGTASDRFLGKCRCLHHFDRINRFLGD